MPKRWPLVPLEELLAPVSRPEAVDTDKIYRILGAHWYAQGLYVKDVTTGAGIQAKSLYRVEEGDFVYNRLFAWKGSFALATKENDGCYVSNEFPCFAVNRSRLDGRFLWRFFSRSSVWDDALAESTGGTPTSRNRLKEQRFLAFKIPLPPLDEQRRIVARIEQLATKIQEARGLREHAFGLVNALAESYLDPLFGKFPNKPLLDLIEPNSRISYGVLVPGDDFPDGIPFVRVQDLDMQNPPVKPNKSISPDIDAHYTRTRLRGGEVLVGVVGSIGKIGIAPMSWAGANIARAVCRILPGPLIDRDYLAAVLQSTTIQRYFRDATRTLAQPTLNVRLLEQTPVPLPPLPQQRRIVAYLAGLQAKVDALKKLQAETAAELDALLPSILDRAFRGELRGAVREPPLQSTAPDALKQREAGSTA